MANIGDIIYRGSSVWKRLVGNTTTAHKVLCQTGTGSGSAAPVWEDATLLQPASVTLTDAQIKALPTTPITIVAAPASGYRVVIVGPVTFKTNTTAGIYTNINATYASLQVETSDSLWMCCEVFNDSTTTPATTDVTDWLGAAGTKMFDQPTPYMEARGAYIRQTPISVVSNFEARSLRVAMDNNGSGNLTGGNAANSLTVSFLYYVRAI